MTQIPTISPPIGQDTLCIGCGYNLRGLEPGGRCPECGLPVADSIRGDRLHFADVGWLRKLRFGATLKLWNLLIGFVVGGSAGLLSGTGGYVGLAFFLGAVAGVLGLWATFAITSPEPRTLNSEDPVTLRKIIRYCAVAAFVVSLVGFLEGSPALTASTLFWILINLLELLVGLAVQLGELKYFQAFALRAPEPQLAQSTRILMWGLGITYSLTAVGGALLAWHFPTIAAGAGPPPAVIVSGCVFGLAFFVFGLWYIVLLFRYRKLFQYAMEHSQRTAHPS